MTDQPFEIDAGTLRITVRLAIYDLGTVQRAAHRFTGRCAVCIEPHSAEQNAVLCRLRPIGSLVNLQSLAEQFWNELLDQALRRRLEEQTAPVRALLLAQAFSRLNLAHPEFDAGDPVSDPQGISRPDTEEQR